MVASVSQFVLKVHSRCDLSCDYCYVYNHADQSWRVKPRVLPEETARQAAARIAEHAVSHRIERVHVVLHGGEPLLLGHDRLGRVLKILRSAIEPVSLLDLRIQTNGVLLDERLCALFAEHGVQVGVSMDGDRVATDRHRRFPDGRSSHNSVLRALTLLRRPRYRSLYAGILCTVDLANDPTAVYEALLAQEPPAFDLLLPHATWDQPPLRPDGGTTAYGTWLGQIYARWMADGCPVPIRLFDSLRSAWAGHGSGTEAVGLDPVDLLVIDTDGAWEQADSLKTAFDGAPNTNLNVFAHSVDQAVEHPGVSIRLAGRAGLCNTCRACPVVRACGGGLYAHRYSRDNGFANPSVYCDDLKALAYRVAASQAPVTRPTPGPGSARGHVVPPAAFDLLAAGPGDTAAMMMLSDANWSVRRALMAAVATRLDGGGRDLGRAAIEGWALLTRLDAEHPEAVREILSYPYAQAWALRCLSRGDSADADLLRAHLAGLAAAAALRAGVEAELLLPVREGVIHLPTVGALVVSTGGPTAVMQLSPSGISCAADVDGWQTVRRISVPGLSVTVDDLDPFRDCGVWPATGRLADGTWRSWRLALAAAGRRLASTVPAYAAVMQSGLRSLMPMVPHPDDRSRSATARYAFGALALALPGDVDTLCELLLHEMQHAKLAALADIHDLCDRADDRLYPVPWRPDPRPADGVLHGTYAYLAATEFWRARVRESPAARAGRLSMTYQGWVADGLATLLRTRGLTAEGERFVVGMRATVEGWG